MCILELKVPLINKMTHYNHDNYYNFQTNTLNVDKNIDYIHYTLCFLPNYHN